MRTGRSIGWLLLFLLGLNVLESRPAAALEVVQYMPGSSFTFNPIAGNPNQDFGIVNVQSENTSGWKLQVRSLNHGALKYLTSNDSIHYTLIVNGDSVDLSGGNDVTAKTTTTLTCNQPNVCNYPIQGTIGAGAIEGKPAGSYTDTLVFTLTNQ